MKKKTKIALLIAGLISATGILICIRSCATASSTAQQYRVKKERREFIVEISGNIEAANEQSFNASADTLIEKIYFKEGDRIKKGQVMIQLDALEQDYNILNQEYQIEQKRLTGANKDIELMKKQLEVLKKRLEDRQCIARFDGILAQLSVEEGEFVEAKDALGVLIDRSYLKATVEVAETDALKLRVGQSVSFTFPAYDQPITGYIDYIPSVGTITSRGATVVNAEVRIDNPPDEILTGFSFTGTIQLREPENILLIEKAALSKHGGKYTAKVLKSDGLIESRDVKAEVYGTMHMLIHSGLSEGETVVAPEKTRKEITDAPATMKMPGMGGGRSAAPGRR